MNNNNEYNNAEIANNEAMNKGNEAMNEGNEGTGSVNNEGSTNNERTGSANNKMNKMNEMNEMTEMNEMNETNNIRNTTGNKNNNNKNKTKKNNNNRENKLTLNNNLYKETNETNTNVNNSDNNITTVESLTNNNENKNSTKDLMSSMNRLCMNLINHQIVLKLFHFQTDTYGAHKASDAYIETYAKNMDKFLEVAQGIYGKVTLKKYSVSGSSHTNENIEKHLNGMVIYLREKINDILDNNTELINIRDELISDLEQLKYLLTFK